MLRGRQHRALCTNPLSSVGVGWATGRILFERVRENSDIVPIELPALASPRNLRSCYAQIETLGSHAARNPP